MLKDMSFRLKVSCAIGALVPVIVLLAVITPEWIMHYIIGAIFTLVAAFVFGILVYTCPYWDENSK